MILIGENLNVMVKKIGTAMKEKDPKPIRQLALAEAEAGVHAMIAHDGPFYYRCGYKKQPPIHSEPIRFELGKAITAREGSDATILFTGTIGNQVMPAAEQLAAEGINCRVVSLHTVKPIDRAAIVAAARETGAIIAVEEHQLQGGLGSAVAECLSGLARHAPVLRLGVRDCFGESGLADELLEKHGLQPGGIHASILARLRPSYFR